jgi:hypothetical protein
MCIASRKRITGRLRQNAARRVILSGYSPGKLRYFTGNMPISSIISVYFRNRRGVFLALAGCESRVGFRPCGGR